MTRIRLLPLVLALAGSVAACDAEPAPPSPSAPGPGPAPTSTTPTTNPPVERLSGKVTFAGSTTVQPLASRLGDAFRKLHPDLVLDIAAGGSVVGINAVHAGTADIGMCSRELRAKEAEGIQSYTIALDVIALVVHRSNPVGDIARDRVRAIYMGEITDWSEVGGSAGPIIPVVREKTSGTRGAFDDIVLGGKSPSAPALRAGITAGDIAVIVSENPGAIGYVGFGNIEDSVKVLTVGGVVPTPDSARAGDYTIVRPLLLLTGALTQPTARKFIEFATGPEGKRVVAAEGWIAPK